MKLTQMIHLNKKGTFLDQWCRYLECVDAPLGFRFWSGMWLLSEARGRRYPQTLSLAFVDTRSGPARRVVEETHRFLLNGRKNFIIDNDDTPLSMVSRINHLKEMDVPHIPVIFPDLEGFCLSDRRTRFGTATIAKAIGDDVPVLGVCTERWLTYNRDRHLDERYKDLTLFIPHGSYKRRPAATPPQAKALWKLYCSIGEQAAGLDDIHSNTSAQKIYDQWYTSASNRYDLQPDHVRVVAALLSMNRNAWEVNKDDMENAIALISNLERERTILFGKKIVIEDEVADRVERIVYQIAKAGKAGIRDVMLRRALRNTVKARDIGVIVSILHELELVQLTEVKEAGMWTAVILGHQKLFTPEGMASAIRSVKKAVVA